MNLKQLTLTVVCMLFLPLLLTAQAQTVNNRTNSTNISISGGSSLYYGDIRVNDFKPVTKDHSELGWSGSVGLQHNYTPWLFVRLQALGGTYAGTKRNNSDGTTADLAFDSKYIEANLGMGLDIVRLFNPESRFSLYAFGGMGFFAYQAEFNDLKYFTSGNPTMYENMKVEMDGEEPSFHFGAGMAYQITDNFQLFAEGSLRPVMSDAIDAYISGDKNDKLQYIAIGANFKFRQHTPAPRVVNTPTQVDKPVANVEEVKENIKTEEEKTEDQPKVIKKVKPETKKVEKVIKEDVAPPPPSHIKYRVQIAASYNKELSIPDLANKHDITELIYDNKYNDWYLYSVGEFSDSLQAEAYALEVNDKYRINGAFVVKYDRNKRVLPEILERPKKVKKTFKPIAKGADVTYKIQVLALSETTLNGEEVRTLLNIEEEVTFITTDTWNLYFIHETSDLDEARQLRNEYTQKYSKEAVIIAFRNNNPIF